MEQVNGKAAGKAQTFEEFQQSRKARQDAELAQLSEQAERPARRKRKPAAVEPPKEASVSDLLLQAVRIMNSRRGRVPRDERIREQILMDILTDAVKGAE